MAITFLNDMGCNLSPRPGEATSSEQVAFHRHCQATVCSAYGYQGNGKTWQTIDDLNLSNIPSDWKDYFTKNSDNITQDLASILELIDKIAGTIGVNFSIRFNYGDFPKTSVNETSTYSSSSSTLSFNLGRDLNLSINDWNFKFNTLKYLSDESLRITIPQKTVTISKNGTNNSFTTLSTSDTSQTIDVSHDYCLVPGKSTATESTTGKTVTPEKNIYVYRWSTSTSFDLTVDLKNYWGTNYETQNLIQFEYHISNTGSSTININNIYLKENGRTISIPIQALTDKLTIDSHRINVYVFRIDCYGYKWKRMTYSLAYVTEWGTT